MDPDNVWGISNYFKKGNEMTWINEFKQKLFSFNAKDLDIGGAFALKEKNLPKSIFKYRAYNDHSIKNLEDDTIWLADPKTLNDPFDCAHTINFSKIQKSKSKSLAQGFFEIRDTSNHITEEQKASILSMDDPMNELTEHILNSSKFNDKQRRMMLDMMNNAYEEMSLAFSSKISSSFKLCSFSEFKNSILMWAHYSDYHKGFCIEYDIEGRSFSNIDYVKRFLYPVIYQKEILDLTEHFDRGINDEQFNNLLPSLAALIKAEEWSYEKEWRLVFSNNVLQEERPYEIGKPKAVYLGAKIEPEKQQVIMEICEGKDIPVYKMEVSHDKFNLKASTVHEADEKIFS